MTISNRSEAHPEELDYPQDRLPYWVNGRAFGVASTLISGALTIWAMLWWLVDDNAAFMALGWAAAFVVGLPFLHRASSLHSPWSLVVASVYVGCAIRGTFIALQIEGPGRSLDTLFLLGEAPDYFIGPSILHLAGIVTLTIGYAAITSRSEVRVKVKGRAPRRPLGRGTPLVVVALAAVGFVAFVLYARATGGFDFAALSAKRTTINGLNLSDDYASHGELRFLNGFAAAAFWLAVTYSGVMRRQGQGRGLTGVLLVVLGLNAILLPFYASSRSDAAFILLVAGAIHFALGGRFSRRAVVSGIAAIVALLSVMTTLRSSDGPGGTMNAASAGLESFVYNRNFGDMQNTSHIVRNVPDVVPFQDGSTMVGYLVAPVPRSIWPDKPIVNAGPLLGVYIYGTVRSGVPPGVFGDLYLNFGSGAVIAGSAVIGLMLGGIDRWRRRLRLNQPVALMVYCAVGFRFGLFAMNKGIAFAVFKGAMELVPVLIAVGLALASAPAARRSVGRR